MKELILKSNMLESGLPNEILHGGDENSELQETAMKPDQSHINVNNIGK